MSFVGPPTLDGSRRSVSCNAVSTLGIGQRQYPKERVDVVLELLHSRNELLRQENHLQVRKIDGQVRTIDGLVRQLAALTMQSRHLQQENQDLRKQIEAFSAPK